MKNVYKLTVVVSDSLTKKEFQSKETELMYKIINGNTTEKAQLHLIKGYDKTIVTNMRTKKQYYGYCTKYYFTCSEARESFLSEQMHQDDDVIIASIEKLNTDEIKEIDTTNTIIPERMTRIYKKKKEVDVFDLIYGGV